MLYLPSIYLLELCMLRLGFCRSDCTQVPVPLTCPKVPTGLGPYGPNNPKAVLVALAEAAEGERS